MWPPSSSKGRAEIRRSLDRLVAKDRLSADDATAAVARIATATDLDAAAEADVVVEAVVERLDVKQQLFRELDRLTKPDVAGFVTTRLIVALSVEAAKLGESGIATAEDVDTPCRLGFGHAMGPLEAMDLTGVDVSVNASRGIAEATADPKFAPPEITVRMAAAGDLARKTGQGWYPHR